MKRRLTSLRSGPKTLPKGGQRTALWDAISESLALFGGGQVGDIIYTITEGHDSVSRSKAEALEQALLTTGVRLFVFLFLPRLLPPPQAPQEILGPSELSELMRDTGGMITLSHGMGSPPEPALVSLYRQMLWFYRIELALPQPINKPEDWKLELTNAQLGERKGLRVIYPRKLMPCIGNKASR